MQLISHSVTAKLAGEGKDIILAMHSYGGIPGTESARGLAKIDREAEGFAGGIIRLVYYATFLPEEGQSLRDIAGATPESVPMEDGFMIIGDQLKAIYAPIVYSDLPEERGIEWVGKMEEHSTASFNGKLTYPAYKLIPDTYLVCENDKVISPELQRKMVQTAREQLTMDMDVISCPAGHGINVSMPEAVVNAIKKAVGTAI